MKPKLMISLRAVPQFFTGLLLATLLGCTFTGNTSIKEYSAEADADFSQLKTYRWDFAAMGKVQPDGSHLAEVDHVLCEHVDQHMAERGFKRIDSGNADFTLDYRLTVNREEASLASGGAQENEQQANKYGLRWSFDRNESPSFQGLQAPKDQSIAYRNGTLHLGAFNSQGQAIWHSSATRILSERGNEAERRAAIRVAVDKLMETFPDAKKK